MTHPEGPMITPPTGMPGLTDDMITFGQSAALTGPSKALGEGMRLGIRAAFAEANANGGVHERRLELTTRDDMYESDQAFAKTRQLIGQDGVFGLIGAVGTPTSRAALPLAKAGKVPFVGAFTGAQLLREDDQDFILNVRASYHDETEQMVAYLKSMGKTKVAVLYQNDSYGQDGLKGVENALKQPGREDMTLVQSWYYGRNTTAVKAAAFRINKAKPDAVIIIGGYAPTAKFIEQLRMRMMDDPTFMAVSFVGSNALRDELVRLEETTSDVYVTQVVPLPSDESVTKYRDALSAVDPDAEPGFVSLEGYLAGRLAIERLKACGTNVTRECFLNVFSEDTPPIDIAGLQLQYGPGDNQGSDEVFLTRINDAGQFELVAE
ncbi:MAG: ABC transporter substrate-binding protein [Chloroflexi bacterium]|nr:ABC transporter substrate-binding protein [Chloroflexota bacterium]